MLRILILFPMLLILFQGGIASAEDQLTRALEGVRHKYQDLPGLAVDYTREVVTRSMSMLGNEVKGDLASGRIYFKPPYFLRLEQKAPKPETIVTDGSILWWYIPDEKQAYEYSTEKFGKELKLLSDVFRGLSKVQDNFKAKLLGRTPEGGYKLQLTPEPPWQEVEHIELQVGKDYAVHQVDIYNQMGGMTRFVLKALQVKDAFPKDFFHFAPPEGVNVQKESS